MRALWIDAGNDPDWNKVRDQRMTALFFAASDPVSDTNRRCKQSRALGYASGVYMAWNWPGYDGLTGTAMAERFNDYFKQLEKPVKAQFNIELHDPDLVAACLERWRQLQPAIDTSWTMEGFQGGWMTAAFVARILACKVRFVPQGYTGPMTPTDSLALSRDLTKRGIPDSLVSPFYDAAHLHLYWDGFAFTQGRLP